MTAARAITLTSLAMLAFAGNSLLCRLALKYTAIDAASFTTIRLVSGALILWLIVRVQRGRPISEGSWPSALALFVYAAAFSFAYVSLSAATGALLLFGAVQATMIGYGIISGERLLKSQVIGLVIAFAGLVSLLLPGLSTPPLYGCLLMLAAGMAWGIYSLRGRRTRNPIEVTAGNFLRSVPVVIALSAFMPVRTLDNLGIVYAVASGALASGLGYVVWYTALPSLNATQAATVQLSVPIIAALGGVVFLGETISLRLVLASIAVLGGIAVVVLKKHRNGMVPHSVAGNRS